MRGFRAPGLSLLMSTCGDPASAEDEAWPANSAEGERVRFGTFAVEQVCAGTIAALDAELTRVERALALGPVDAQVDAGDAIGRCGS